jgi:hypothetical protein
MTNSTPKAIVLRMPEELLSAIDDVRHELRMNRTSWLLKAARCQLEYAKRHELPLLRDAAIRRALQPEPEEI